MCGSVFTASVNETEWNGVYKLQLASDATKCVGLGYALTDFGLHGIKLLKAVECASNDAAIFAVFTLTEMYEFPYLSFNSSRDLFVSGKSASDVLFEGYEGGWWARLLNPNLDGNPVTGTPVQYDDISFSGNFQVPSETTTICLLDDYLVGTRPDCPADNSFTAVPI